MEQFEELKQKFTAEIRSRLSDYRYRHSLGTAKAAVHLAEKYGADVQKAEIAGILHDITKETSVEEQLKILKEFGIIVDDVVLRSKNLFHAYTGALVAEHTFGIKDPEILDAIRYHTTGRAEMTLLDKVLYIADYISEDRKYGDVEQLRVCAEQSLDLAVLESLAYTIVGLIRRGSPVHIDTVHAYNAMMMTGAGDELSPRFVR